MPFSGSSTSEKTLPRTPVNKCTGKPSGVGIVSAPCEVVFGYEGGRHTDDNLGPFQGERRRARAGGGHLRRRGGSLLVHLRRPRGGLRPWRDRQERGLLPAVASHPNRRHPLARRPGRDLPRSIGGRRGAGLRRLLGGLLRDGVGSGG